MNNSWSWKSCPICVGSVPSRKFVERSLSLKREREQKISWGRENHLTFFLFLSFKIFQKWEKYYKIVNWESCPIWLGIVPRKWFFPKSLFCECVLKKRELEKENRTRMKEKVKMKRKKKKWNNVFNKVSSPISLGIVTAMLLSLRDLKSKKLEKGERKEGRKRGKVKSWKNEEVFMKERKKMKKRQVL